MSEIDEELERMRDRHEAIARYRLYLFEPRKGKGKQKTEIERGLTYKEAKGKAERLNDELKAAGRNRFMDETYGIELVNTWDTMTEEARQRMLALGKKESDFRL